MQVRTLNDIDQYWSEAFGCDLPELWNGDVNVGVHQSSVFDGRTDIYVFHRLSTVRVSIPPNLKHLASVITACGRESLLTEPAWRSLLGDDFSALAGPSTHFHRDELTGTADDRVLMVTPDTAGLVDHLRESVLDVEWSESGMDTTEDVVRFVTIVDNEPVAASKLGKWRNVDSDIGVVTAPAHRGHGFGAAVVAAAANHAVEHFGIARYRALPTNTASVAIAQRLGFEPYGQNIVVRLHEKM